MMKKIIYNIDRVVGGEINAELFKKLEGKNIWEFRTLYNGRSYRLFAFWDSCNGTFVIVTHGIVKKTQRTHIEGRSYNERISKGSKKMTNMKTYTFDEVKDELLGKVGTPERDEHDRKVAEAVNAFRLGEVVRERRLDQNLTQEELGRRMGVKKSQISKLERGDDMSLRSMRRVFRALGVESATLDLGAAGKVTLW